MLFKVIKGVDEEFKDKIMCNMFKCVVEMFNDDLEVFGFVCISEVEIV